MRTILCPIPKAIIDAPAHLRFGIDYFEIIAKEKFGCDVKIKKVAYMNGGGHICLLENVRLLIIALFTSHDLLYYGIDPKNLSLLAFFSRLGIYNKPMCAFKYTVIKREGILRNLYKKMVYNSFYKIFMLTENHVKDSYREGLVKANKLEYVKWGEDINYVKQFSHEKSKPFTFISTGKAFRDFKTLCAAFEGLTECNLKIYTSRRFVNTIYDNYLNQVSNKNIVVTYTDEIDKKKCGNLYDYFFSEMCRADCALSICEDVNFGVGYTQILDSMACGLPIIATYNKDNPIDVDKQGVGISVRPYDVECLHQAMITMKSDCYKLDNYRQRIKDLMENEYNIEIMAEKVLGIILNKIKKDDF